MRMMRGVPVFLIFGFRTKAQGLGWVSAGCHVCGHAGNMMLVRESTKLSIFFIPLITVRSRDVLECPVCRSHIRIDKSEARRLLDAGTRAGY